MTEALDGVLHSNQYKCICMETCSLWSNHYNEGSYSSMSIVYVDITDAIEKYQSIIKQQYKSKRDQE